MAPHHSDSGEVENGTAGAAALVAEVEALRRRLAAFEARLPESAAAAPPERRPAKARSSAKTVVGLTTGAALAILAGGAIAYGADALIIGPDGVTIAAKSINFGTRLGALLTLYDPDYAIGIQHGTLYQRSYKNFAWYKGGGHADTELDPGGGSKMMSLTDGNLDIAGSVKAKSLDVDGAGSVTAGTVTAGTVTVNDKDKGLTVSGPIKIDGKNVLAFGVGNNKNDDNSGTIGYQVHTSDALDIVGAGDGGQPRKIKFWAEGGATLAGSLDVSGVVDGNMKVVYQRDDEAQTTYQKPLWRYHMSLTAAKYAGKTKTIPKEILTALCGKPDGCEVRLGMTRWDNGKKTQTAPVANRFYYSPADGHWRINWPRDTEGVIGDGSTTHAMSAWDTCFFTDGTYENYLDKGDKGTGMQLLVWNKNNDPARTCELTIIP